MTRSLSEVLTTKVPPGLTVDHRCVGRERALTSDVLEALAGATAEALRNVRRHALVDRAEVKVRYAEDSVEVTISDQGVGFASDSAQSFGINSSIKARVTEVGGRVDVRSKQGGGTSVHLTWRSAYCLVPSLEDVHQESLAAVGETSLVARVAFPLVLSNGYLALRYGPQSAEPSGQLALLLVLVLATVITVCWVSWWRLTWRRVVFHSMALCTLLAAHLALAGPGALTTYVSWGIGFTCLPLVLVAFVTPTRCLPVLLMPLPVVAIAIVLDPASDLLPSAGALSAVLPVLVSSLIGQYLRQTRRQETAQRSKAAKDRAIAQSNGLAEQVRELHFEYSRSTVGPWLSAIVDGTSDPEDPDVRRDAAVYACALRDDLYLPGVLPADARQIVDQLRRRGVVVDLRSGFNAALRHQAPAVLLRALRDLDTDVRITIKPPDPAGLVRCVVTPAIAATKHTQVAAALGSNLVRFDTDEIASTISVHDRGMPIPGFGESAFSTPTAKHL